MDEFDLLRGLREEVPPATPAGLLGARTALLRELEHARAVQARPVRLPVGRMVWRMAAGVGLAAALTVALFAVQGGRVPHDQAGTPDTSAASSDLAQILRNAALAARHEQILPARPDQYVFVESVIDGHGSERFTCDGKVDQSHCTVIRDPRVRTLYRQWRSVDGTRNGLVRERPQAGNGTWHETPLEVCPQGVVIVGPDGKRRTPTCTPQPGYHAELPTNAEAMLQYLLQRAREHNKHDEQSVGDSYAFTVAGDLIRSGYVPPASLAAMFEAMTRIPGLSVAQDAVDAAGRHGISVGWQGHGVRNEMIFNAATYAYLGERTIALQDVDGLKKGDIDGQSAQLRLVIVDRPGQLP